jgi:hypothetical protein
MLPWIIACNGLLAVLPIYPVCAYGSGITRLMGNGSLYRSASVALHGYVSIESYLYDLRVQLLAHGVLTLGIVAIARLRNRSPADASN